MQNEEIPSELSAGAPATTARSSEGRAAPATADAMHDSATLAAAATGSILGISGTIGGRALALLLQVLVSRFYGPTCFGLFVTGMLVCYVLQIIASVGLQKGAMRFMAIAIEKGDTDECAEIFKISVLAPLAFGIPVIVAGHWLAPLIAQRAFNNSELVPVFRVFLMAAPFFGLLKIGSNVSRAFKTAKYSVPIDDLLFPALQILFFVVMHQLGLGFLSVAYSFVAAAMVCSFLMLLCVWRQIQRFCKWTLPFPHGFSAGRWGAIMAYSLPILPVSLMFMANNFMDITMLNILAGARDVGLYAAAARWVMVFGAITVPLELMFGPLIAAQFGVNNRAKMQMFYQTLTRWAFFSSLPILIFVLLGRTPLMMLFGREFSLVGARVLGILIMGTMITSLTCGASITLIVSGNQKFELFAISTGLALNVLLNLLLVPAYGILGTAVAVLVSGAANNALRLLAVFRSLRLNPLTRHLTIPALLVAFIAALDIFILHRRLSSLIFPQLVLATVAAMATAFTVFKFGLDEDDLSLLKVFLQKVRIRRGRATTARTPGGNGF